MPTFNNLKDLEKMLDPYFQKAAIKTRDEIFEIVSNKVSEYYSEQVFEHEPYDVPDYYERTGNLMESLTASHVTKTKNGYEFTVGWDEDYLSFRYPFSGYGIRATGKNILEWNSRNGSHGGTVDGNIRIWNDSVEELNKKHGSVEELFIKNLKKCGVPIIH